MNHDHDAPESGNAEEIADALVRLGRRDKPPRMARARALRAIALGAVISVPAKSAALAASTAGGASGGAPAAAATTSSFLVVAKWGAIGALSATALVGAVDGVGSLAKPDPAGEPRSLPALVVSRGGAIDRRASSVESPPPAAELERKTPFYSVQPLPRAAAPLEAKVVAKSPAAPARAAFEDTRASQLAAEVRVLDAARNALTGGRIAEALSHLDRHAVEFSSGILHGEAAAVRVEALVKAGAITEAERLARGFLAAHPKSPLGARVRALVPVAASSVDLGAIGSGSRGHSSRAGE